MRLLLFTLLLSVQFVLGQTTIAYTSFEELTAVGGKYVDSLDAATDHALVNHANQPYVNYTSTGGELGFSSYYYNTRNDVGLTDGDYVGVTNYTGAVGSYPDGSNGFQLSDCDGKMETTFDEVNLSGHTSAYVSIASFVQETGWESDDEIRMWVVVDGGTEIDLLNTAGSDIDDLGIEDAWDTLEVALTGYSTATLKVSLDCNSGDEALYIDNIQFTEESISAIEPVSDHKVVKQYKLYSNYPNPFNPTTTLKFDVPQNTRNVELSIYNILGVKVKTLYSGSVNAGQYTSVWDGTNEAGEVMPSGVYFATLKTENFSQTIKMMLMK